jgi:hypothetical protein
MSRTEHPTEPEATQDRAFWDSDPPTPVWVFAACVALLMMLVGYLATVLAAI